MSVITSARLAFYSHFYEGELPTTVEQGHKRPLPKRRFLTVCAVVIFYLYFSDPLTAELQQH